MNQRKTDGGLLRQPVEIRNELLIGLFLLGSLAYMLVGLAPYSFEFTRPSRIHLLFVTPWNGALNFLCFLPLGFVIAKMSFIDHPLIAAFWVCGAMSLIVEMAQLFLPGRFCCVSDWVLNTTGAVAGAWLAGLPWADG